MPVDETVMTGWSRTRVMFGGMPVIVVGADTPAGGAILDRLNHPERELRAFVTSLAAAEELRREGVKVALGDVSDDSHVEGASYRCFTAVLVAEAAADDRERSFADTTEDVLAGWARAVSRSEVRRVIWVTSSKPPLTQVEEVATVDPSDPDLADKVAALDDAQKIRKLPSA